MNLAGDPDYAEVREELAARLLEKLLDTGDPRARGAGDEFDAVPYLGHGPRHPSYKPE